MSIHKIFIKTYGIRVNMLALDLIITESSICLRDVSGINEAQETDAFQNTRKYFTV